MTNLEAAVGASGGADEREAAEVGSEQTSSAADTQRLQHSIADEDERERIQREKSEDQVCSRLLDSFVPLVRDKSEEDILMLREAGGADTDAAGGVRGAKKKKGKQVLTLQDFHSMRVDPEDGNAYPLDSFLEVYGEVEGQRRWAAAYAAELPQPLLPPAVGEHELKKLFSMSSMSASAMSEQQTPPQNAASGKVPLWVPAPAPVSAGHLSSNMDNGIVNTDGILRPMDGQWRCGKALCANLNWPMRANCNRCSAARPAPRFGEGGGGGHALWGVGYAGGAPVDELRSKQVQQVQADLKGGWGGGHALGGRGALFLRVVCRCRERRKQ